MFLLDVGEEGRVGKVPLAAGTAELAFCFFLGFDRLDWIGSTVLLTHHNISINSNQPPLTPQRPISNKKHSNLCKLRHIRVIFRTVENREKEGKVSKDRHCCLVSQSQPLRD